MRTVDIIQKKKEGCELTSEEIRYLIDGYTSGRIPDYQMAAWAMAVWFKGMTPTETAELTKAMAASGDQVDLGGISGTTVDKHSTGGVGDKTTLVLAPLVSAAGVPVAKMSGRGLGHTGGTVDKLEAIPGFAAERTRRQFIEQVNRIGMAVISQTGNVTPADKKLYSLRDVTATVDSIPLIASSIMSKKIAAGADAILLDVKTGSGAFMEQLEDAERLASAMVGIGEQLGRTTAAVISGMDQPLGLAVGNALEVAEAIHTLRGEGPEDLTELSLTLGSHMLVMGGKAESVAEARVKLEKLLRSGAALEQFRRFIDAQGGDPQVVNHPDKLPQVDEIVEIRAEESGFVRTVHAKEIGVCASLLGAGRDTKEARIDAAAGIVIHKKIADPVQTGEILAVMHPSREAWSHRAEIARRVREAFAITDSLHPVPPLILAEVTSRGICRYIGK